MALAESSAFTEQWRTAITSTRSPGTTCSGRCSRTSSTRCSNPDYTDEEIRREVRNFGVDKADDGTLRLEEKGTVYNEMVRTYEAPETVLWRDGRSPRLRRASIRSRSSPAAIPTRSAR